MELKARSIKWDNEKLITNHEINSYKSLTAREKYYELNESELRLWQISIKMERNHMRRSE